MKKNRLLIILILLFCMGCTGYNYYDPYYYGTRQDREINRKLDRIDRNLDKQMSDRRQDKINDFDTNKYWGY